MTRLLCWISWTFASLATPLMFTVVPPSPGNPTAKLNLDLSRRLTNDLKVQGLETLQGRLRFSPGPETPHYTKWCVILSTVKSIRWVVAELEDLTPGDAESVIADKLEQCLAGISKESILSMYDTFGNHLPNNKSLSDSERAGPTFKLSVRRWDGCILPKGKISTISLSHELRRVIAQRYDWMPHYRKSHGTDADMEFQVILHESCCMLELVLSVPAVLTGELPRPGCKRVEAWMLVQSGEIQDGDVVLDPLCGKATYLVEGATTMPSDTRGVRFIGVDQSADQLEHARENIVETRTHACIELNLGDARRMDFLSDGSVNVILTCPPFGIQFGVGTDLHAFYRDCLREWMRVLTATGRLALLVDVQNADSMIQVMKESDCLWLQVHREPFRLGRLQATVLVAKKVEADTKADSITEPASVLPWEGHTPLTRTGWNRMRADSLPSLAPYRP